MTNTPPTGTVPDPTAVDASTTALNANNDAQDRQGTLLQQNAQYMDTLSSKMDGERNTLNLLSDFVNRGSNAFSNLSSQVSHYMDELNSSAELTSSNMNKMSLAITAAVGAAEPFKGSSFDGLTTFSSQIGDLVDATGGALDKLQGLAGMLGLKIPSAIGSSADKLGAFIKNTALSADYSLKTEDIYIRLAARTGELGEGYLNLSKNTEHMNRIAQDQINAFTQASRATNISIDDAQKYYVALKAIPGALQEMNEADAHATGGISDLTKTIQLARGTGREFSDVVSDMHEAIRAY